MIKTAVILFFCLCPIFVFPQVVIRGTVYDEDKIGQVAVAVTLNTITGEIIAYKFTDINGSYSFNYSGNADSILVRVSGLSIREHVKKIKAAAQILDFTVEAKPMELRQVVVRGRPIYGNRDTINYSVSAFLTDQDIVIEDIIKKLPGINVSGSGGISYQGKPINKFYIENMDLLGGAYGLATKNISARDINTVQILENHQPIKALDSIQFSDQAAVNLKLKDEAKGTFTMMAQGGVGAGPSLLWNNSLSGMFFGRKKQNMTIYKGNNSGQDLTGEFQSHTARDYFGNQNMLYVRMPSPPSIDRSRYLFNNTNAFTFNELRKLSSDAEVKYNVIYLNDHINRHGNSRTSYYIPGQQIRVLEEDITTATDINRLKGDMRYTLNGANKYLNNLLQFDGLWESNLGNVITDDRIIQRMRTPSISVTDHFNLIKTNENNSGYTLSASTGFKNSPQTLNINKGLYPDVLNGGEEYYGIRQDLDIQKAYFTVDGSLLSLFSLGEIKFDTKASADIQYSNLASDIFLRDAAGIYNRSADNEMANDFRWAKMSGNIGGELRYDRRDFKISVTLPVTFSNFNIRNRKENSNKNLNRIYFQPSFNFRYQFGPKLQLSGSYGFNNSTGDIQSIYTGYILQDYRSLNRYDGQLPESLYNGGSVSLEYKNLIRMLFANINANYSNIKNNMLTEQTFEDILIITSRLPISNRSERHGFGGQFSKGFDLMNLTLKISGGYSESSSQSRRQGVLLNYYNEGVNLSGSVNMKPVKFIILSYEGQWGKSASRISSGEKFTPIRAFVNNATLSVSPFKGFFIKGQYEHYYNSAALNNRYFSFTDLGLSYRIKNIDMSLDWRNIFNTKSFITTYYSDINMYQSTYDIRPASVLFTIKMKIL